MCTIEIRENDLMLSFKPCSQSIYVYDCFKGRKRPNCESVVPFWYIMSKRDSAVCNLLNSPGFGQWEKLICKDMKSGRKRPSCPRCGYSKCNCKIRS